MFSVTNQVGARQRRSKDLFITPERMPPFLAAERPGSKVRWASFRLCLAATWKPSKSPESCGCLGCQAAATGPQSAGAQTTLAGCGNALGALTRRPARGCRGARSPRWAHK